MLGGADPEVKKTGKVPALREGVVYRVRSWLDGHLQCRVASAREEQFLEGQVGLPEGFP